jgi:hypothetical protein
LAAVSEREVNARDASGAQLPTKAAGFPTRKTIEDFISDHQPALKRETIAHLTTGAFVATAQNVVLLGPPGTGKTHLPSVSASKQPKPGTVSYSPPRLSGSGACKPLTTPPGSPMNSSG